MNKIIDIDYNTIVLRVGVSPTTVCECNMAIEHVDLYLISAEKAPPPRAEYYSDGCKTHVEYVSCEQPQILYPLFEIDTDNNLVFYFDALLYKMKPGRYKAEIRLHKKVIVQFDVALFLRTHKVNIITTEAV